MGISFLTVCLDPFKGFGKVLPQNKHPIFHLCHPFYSQSKTINNYCKLVSHCHKHLPVCDIVKTASEYYEPADCFTGDF